MGNMREPVIPRMRKKPAPRRASSNPVTIADRLRGFIGQCTSTDTPSNTSENYKKLLLDLTKMRCRQTAR